MRKSIINWISSCVRYSRVLIHLLLSLSLSPFLSLFISLKTIHVFHYLKKNTKNNNKKSNCARKTCINSSHVKGIFMLFDSIFCYFFSLQFIKLLSHDQKNNMHEKKKIERIYAVDTLSEGETIACTRNENFTIRLFKQKNFFFVEIRRLNKTEKLITKSAKVVTDSLSKNSK